MGLPSAGGFSKLQRCLRKRGGGLACRWPADVRGPMPEQSVVSQMIPECGHLMLNRRLLVLTVRRVVVHRVKLPPSTVSGPQLWQPPRPIHPPLCPHFRSRSSLASLPNDLRSKLEPQKKHRTRLKSGTKAPLNPASVNPNATAVCLPPD